MASETLRELCNPLLDAFHVYMQPTTDGFRTWTERSDYSPRVHGFSGPEWNRHIDDVTNAFMAKSVLQERCAWAIPTVNAVQAIVDLDMPVVEIGAGNGYWAWILEQAGVEVAAFDTARTEQRNQWCICDHWTTVRHGGPAKLKDPRFDDHALLLCWPPYDTNMAYDSLSTYRGDVLVYVGEGEDGCTGNKRFHQLLPGTDWEEDYSSSTERTSEWTQIDYIELPNWMGLHDAMYIYKRKGKDG